MLHDKFQTLYIFTLRMSPSKGLQRAPSSKGDLPERYVFSADSPHADPAHDSTTRPSNGGSVGIVLVIQKKGYMQCLGAFSSDVLIPYHLLPYFSALSVSPLMLRHIRLRIERFS